ncbi:hypothetical protein ACNF40_00930 [Cuniculiplasma sp. SKW4]|uniref:hypothetical protein n=1 Tax=Cuniculiplasma sp. SKW4 TaxID=3400171 RepID=UPI003FD2E586
MESDCLSNLRRSYTESSRDLNEIIRMDLVSKKRLFAELESLYSYMETKCGESLSTQVMQSGLANFKLAQLKIALALKKEIEGKTINDSDISRIISKFSDDEYEAMEKLDKFSRIDSLNSESITTLLMNKDDQIYRLIKDWYEENMEDFLGSIDILSGKNVRGEISKGMEEKYRTRFDKISEGIIGYIQKDPGQIRKMFINYENAIKRVMNLENKRMQVEKELRELLSSPELLKLNDDFRGILALAQSGNVDELRKKDLDSLIRGFNDFNIKIKGKIAEVESEKGKLQTDFEMRSNPVLKDIEEKRLDSLLEEARETYPSMVLNPLKSLDSLKSITISLSGGSNSTFDSSYSVSADQARLRRDAFFENTFLSLSGKDSVEIFVPSMSFNAIIRKKEITRKIRDMEETLKGFSFISPQLTLNGTGIKGEEGENFSTISRSVTTMFNVSRIFKPDVRFSFNFTFIAHDETFQQISKFGGTGMDQTPLNIKDMSKHYAALLSMSSEMNMYVISVVGSPNGFSEEVIRYVQNLNNNGLSGSSVSIILKDARDGKIYYDKNDKTSEQIVNIISGAADQEEKDYQTVKSETLSECSITGVARNKTIARATGLPEEKVSRAWKRMEKEGLGKVDNVNGEEVFRIAEKGK